MVDWYFRAGSTRTAGSDKHVLCTEAPDLVAVDYTDLSEIATGNNYTAKGETWGTITIWTAGNTGRKFYDVDPGFTASGGDIPASGNPASVIAHIDEDDDLLGYWELVEPLTVTSGTTSTIQDPAVWWGGLNNFFGSYSSIIFTAWKTPATLTSQFKLRLGNATSTPVTDSSTWFSELSTSNGYTAGGIVVERSATGFPTLKKIGLRTVDLYLKDITVTATTGDIGPFRYAALADNGGAYIGWWDLSTPKRYRSTDLMVRQGVSMKLTNLSMRFEGFR